MIPPDPGARRFPATIAKDRIRDLPLLRWTGPTHLIVDDAAASAAVEALSRETVLGFDIEVRPAFRVGQKYPPALVQLAGSETVWLFRLARLHALDGLYALLADPRIVKAGVAVRDDLRKLRELRELVEGGFVELPRLSGPLGIREKGVRGLAACVLGGRIDKGAKLANWAAARLTPAQVDYAATDAWVCREIYLRLIAAAPAAARSPTEE